MKNFEKIKKKSLLDYSLVPKYENIFDDVFFEELVDQEFYLKMYPDVKSAGMSALEHYKKTGFAEERFPNPFFDPNYLSQRYIEKEREVPTIINYLLDDDRRNVNSSPYIDIKKWKYSNSNIKVKTILEDILKNGLEKNVFSFFDLDFYSKQLSSKFGKLGIYELVRHFFTHGIDAGISPNPLMQFSSGFAEKTYHDKYISFRSIFLSPSINPDVLICEIFDVDFYKKKHGETERHPFVDYLYSDDALPRWPHPLFDERFYRSSFKDEIGDKKPFVHFLSSDETLGHNVNQYFDTKLYKKRYSDTHLPGEHPLQHYMRLGHLPWFETSDAFGQRCYLSTYPEVAANEEPALVHYIHQGRNEGFPSLPPKPFFDATKGQSVEQLLQIARDLCPPLSTSRPDVSVIIPVYGQLEFTLRCLISIFKSRDTTSYEIFVADDKSPDGSGKELKEAFRDASRLNVVLNRKNLGFLRSCNNAVKKSRGKYVFLLNNDTSVLDGWLDELIATLQAGENIGVVGSKLLYPNGLLQEAGGLIYRDGSCANYGKLDSPVLPKFNHARDADYISGAAMMLTRELWDKVGGFSDYLAPAYYEDTDIAMKVRREGYRVVFQPKSAIVHYEGITSGTDLKSGAKKHQVINGKKFREVWAEQLAHQPEPGDNSHAVADSQVWGRVLVLDAETPQPDKDSGSITAYYQMKILTELGCRVTFVPENLFANGKYAAQLERLGVEVISYPHERNLQDYLLRAGGGFDFFILSRASAGAKYFNAIRNEFPEKPIVFDTVDLHHLRMQREYELTRNTDLLDPIWKMRELELGTIRKADATILVSEFEIDYLLNEIGPFPSVLLPLIYEDYVNPPPFEGRTDIAFVGGFRHPPNLDAVQFLVEEIWPRFRERDTGAKLHIIGSHMPADMQELASEDIILVGFVENLEAYLANIKITVAPLRYGAGVKGKVGNSLRMGVPVVATSVASEGMGLIDGAHLLVADQSGDFAERMVDLYANETVWTELAESGKAFVMDRFGYESAKRRLRELCNFVLV